MIAFLQGIYEWLTEWLTFAFNYIQTLCDIIVSVFTNLFDAYKFMIKLVNLVPPVFYIPGVICLVALIFYQIVGRDKGT